MTIRPIKAPRFEGPGPVTPESRSETSPRRRTRFSFGLIHPMIWLGGLRRISPGKFIFRVLSEQHDAKLMNSSSSPPSTRSVALA
ncbi:hypothetical protein AOLI_G00019380 [Acnodon oligacanthus]